MSPKTPVAKTDPTMPVADAVGQFEDAMKELETIVHSLERGELRLAESLRLFERGVALARQCRSPRQGAELTVHALLAGDDDDSGTCTRRPPIAATCLCSGSAEARRVG